MKEMPEVLLRGETGLSIWSLLGTSIHNSPRIWPIKATISLRLVSQCLARSCRERRSGHGSSWLVKGQGQQNQRARRSQAKPPVFLHGAFPNPQRKWLWPLQGNNARSWPVLFSFLGDSRTSIRRRGIGLETGLYFRQRF